MSSNAHLQSLMNTFDTAESSAPGSGQTAVDQTLSEVRGTKVDSSATSATVVETTAVTDPTKLVLPDPRDPDRDREPGMVTEAAPILESTDANKSVNKTAENAAQGDAIRTAGDPIPDGLGAVAEKLFPEPEIERWARERHGVTDATMHAFRLGLTAGRRDPGHSITAVSCFRTVQGTEHLFWELHRFVGPGYRSLFSRLRDFFDGVVDTGLGKFSRVVIHRFTSSGAAEAWLVGYRWGPPREKFQDQDLDYRLRGEGGQS